MWTLIQGGTVVTATDTYTGDVLIEDEKILGIGSGFTADRTSDPLLFQKYDVPSAYADHGLFDVDKFAVIGVAA